MKSYKLFFPIIALAAMLMACETTDPFVNDVTLNIFTGDYDAALQMTEDAIAENPDNYIAHYYNGVTLAAMAETYENPTERQSYYERSRASFVTARELMQNQEETPEELQELNDTIIGYWADEYNRGVNIQTDDSLFNITPDPYQTSLAHFENAATINPDSAMTYQVMASTYYQMSEIENAISVYETAMTLLDPPLVDDYEFLISLYLFDNRYESAIQYSEEALELYPDETSFVQFLADAYIQSGERDKAVELIEALIAQEPDNPQYRRVLGTQIYQSVDRNTQEVNELYREMFDLGIELRGQTGAEREETEQRMTELQEEIDRLEAEIDEFTAISIEQMERVVELEPDSESANFILAIIYQNRAANLFERRNNVVNDEELVESLDRSARENLQLARVYYEAAAEINPDNTDNWQSLFQVYTQLGMEEEALEAMEKAGFED